MLTFYFVIVKYVFINHFLSWASRRNPIIMNNEQWQWWLKWCYDIYIMLLFSSIVSLLHAFDGGIGKFVNSPSRSMSLEFIHDGLAFFFRSYFLWTNFLCLVKGENGSICSQVLISYWYQLAYPWLASCSKSSAKYKL